MDIVTIIEAPRVAIHKVKRDTLPKESNLEKFLLDTLSNDDGLLQNIKKTYGVNLHQVQFHPGGINEYHLIIILK